jgi:hypothetical protein
MGATVVCIDLFIENIFMASVRYLLVFFAEKIAFFSSPE